MYTAYSIHAITYTSTCPQVQCTRMRAHVDLHPSIDCMLETSAPNSDRLTKMTRFGWAEGVEIGCKMNKRKHRRARWNHFKLLADKVPWKQCHLAALGGLLW